MNSPSPKLMLVGISTTAQTIYEFISDYKIFDVIGFAVDTEFMIQDTFCGLPVFDIEQLPKSFDKRRDYLFVCIQWNRLNADRRDVYLRLKQQGFRFANIISPHAIIHGTIEGDNCWISDNVVIEPNAIIHNNVFVKTGAIVCHDTTIYDHAFIGARSLLSGKVSVGEQSYVGVCATIFDCTRIGSKCLIGAGTVIKRNVPDFTIIKLPNDTTIIQTYEESNIENKLLSSITPR